MQPITESEMRELENAYNKCAIESFKKMRTCGPNCELCQKEKIEIFYSAEDEGYIAVAPDLPGCSAFGETEEDALKEIKTARKLYQEECGAT